MTELGPVGLSAPSGLSAHSSDLQWNICLGVEWAPEMVHVAQGWAGTSCGLGGSWLHRTQDTVFTLSEGFLSRVSFRNLLSTPSRPSSS